MRRIILGAILATILQGCGHEKDSVQADVPIRLAVTINDTPTVRAQVQEGESVFEANLYRWDYKDEKDDSWKTQRPTTSGLTCNVSSDGRIGFQSPEGLYYTTHSDGSAYETALLSITPPGELDETNQSMTWHAEQLNGKQDVMVAGLIHVGNINESKLGKLVFRHQLSQFNFQVVKRSNSRVSTLQQLMLTSIKLPQKISLLANNPITYTEVESLRVEALPEEGQELPVDQKVTIGTPIMIAPGATALALKMILGLADGNSSVVTAIAPLKEAAKPGVSYRITLEFSTGDTPQPLIAEATIDEWIEGEEGSATIE